VQHIEFSIVDDDDDDRDDLDSNNLEDNSRGSSLENLLVSRNKKLSNDLTILKVPKPL
jgi:homeobox protein cut-like